LIPRSVCPIRAPIARRFFRANECAAAIGDTLTVSASFFACPANVDPANKISANYVSPYEEFDGVHDILQRLSNLSS
jgi:hypothetical protein